MIKLYRSTLASLLPHRILSSFELYTLTETLISTSYGSVPRSLLLTPYLLLYSSSDFLSNLLVLLLRLRNCGIPDGGLLAHLSEATAGSLSGVGHSTAYEELATYS